jgi:histidine ammonia-lyase
MEPLVLDGRSLGIADVVRAARGPVRLALDRKQLEQVERCARFVAAQAAAGEAIYGVTTGFGSNAERLLGKRPLRAELDPEGHGRRPPPPSELQRNLILSHAVGVGEPLAPEVVRAMTVIRINTLMRGHSGVRAKVLERLVRLYNAGLVPVVPEKGSVGASGDLAPLSHLALLLLGEGEAFLDGVRLPGARALAALGLEPLELGPKEGLALNNGTSLMLAFACLSLAGLERLLDLAELAAALSLEAFAGRSAAYDPRVHALRPHPGQLACAQRIRRLLAGSTLVDLDYHLAPAFAPWTTASWWEEDLARLSFDVRWRWVRPEEREGREAFYRRHRPFRGGKKHQPQDAYSLRCVPQVYGAVRDLLARVRSVLECELNAVTDNPIVFPEGADLGEQFVSAGNFHGMPLALALAELKLAAPVVASMSERRIAKLLDPATSDGLPPFLVGNEDATDSGLMIVQYTAAALVNELATAAHPACVYSIPTSANAEDHVSMGATEGRQVLAMLADLERVLALELFVACQALELRSQMIEAARATGRAGVARLIAKVEGAPEPGTPLRPQFELEVAELAAELARTPPRRAGRAAQAVLASLRAAGVAFLERDRALDQDLRLLFDWVARDEPLRAAREALAGAGAERG